jgi:hypothetical protein
MRRMFTRAEAQFILCLAIIAVGVAVMLIAGMALLYLLILVAASGAR